MTKLKITESNIIKAINDYLQIQRNQGKLMFIRNNSGAMPIIDGKNKRRYIRFGDKGSPDFLVFIKSILDTDTYYSELLKTIAVEVKSETNTLSEAQMKWQEDFEKLGGEYYIIRNIDDLIKITGDIC